MAPEWTDEKHSMYIKSIEASFVNQLYDSKQMKTSYDSATTSGQVAFLIFSTHSINLTCFFLIYTHASDNLCNTLFLIISMID